MGYGRSGKIQIDRAYLLSGYDCIHSESQIALCVYDITKK